MKRYYITLTLLLFITITGGQHAFAQDAPAVELQVETEQPLTEAELDGQSVTLKLIGQTWIESEQNIENALTVSGVEGVSFRKRYTEKYTSIESWCDAFFCYTNWPRTRTRWIETVHRVDDNTVKIVLEFEGDFDTDSRLTFTVTEDAIENYDGPALSAEVPVIPYKGVFASATPSLRESTLDGGVVTLTLSWGAYEADVATIINAVSVTGIDGVTIDTATVQRLSDREITVGLNFDRTDFDMDATLFFTVASGAIANYTDDDFTTEIPVTAGKESVSASVVSPLTESTLNVGSISLILTDLIYEQNLSKIRNAVMVSGIKGVTIDAATVKRLSGTELTVELNFDGTDFDETAMLTFSVASGALANYTGDAFTTEISVGATKEVVSASVVSPLTEATLDGSTVTLILTAAAFEQDISTIRDAVTVTGIDGVTVDTATVQRLSDRRIQVELGYDGTDFIRDTALTFTLTSKAIANHNGEVTTEIPVTANSNEDVLTIFWTDTVTEKIQRANLDMANLEVSNVKDLVTGLESPRNIALDVVSGKMYWTDFDSNKIQRANFDGSNVEDLVTGLRSPEGIALDVEGGKMYWTDFDSNKIQRANLDGSNVEDLVTQKGSSHPQDIVLDVAGGKMYWTLRELNWRTDTIQRANMDGSNIENLFAMNGIVAKALDVEGGKMYWTHSDRRNRAIGRTNLDGSDREYPVRGLENPSGIVLDVEGGKMYWTDYGTDKIQRANFDGSNVEDLVTGLDHPYDIAIAMSSLVNPTTEEPTIAKEDVNRDGVVDVNDLVIVAQRYGKTGTNAADVNGDKVVNVDDFILVAAAIDEAAAAAAPAARAQVHSHFTKAQLQGWLTEARASGNTSRTYQRGIAVVEHLLALIAPEETALLANYPNPFNPETWIPYQLSKSAEVTLTIYAVDGHVVRTLALGHQTAGMYQSRSRAAYWDGRNAVGEPVASGLYFYTLTAGDFSATRKMLIRK